MPELVDIVDIYDKPTGEQLTIAEAHERELPHRISAVLVFRDNGNLLVQVHKHHGRKFDHSVGGHVSAREDYLFAAYREMSEELEISVPVQEIGSGILSDEYYEDTGTHIVHLLGVFVAHVSNAWKHTETEEVDNIIEMKVDEVVDLMNDEPDRFLQGFFTSMAAYLKHIGSDKKIAAYGKNWGEL